ncbi:hypothetical protein [Bombilactobacillus thymidiniphilus]|uniref:Uncharacterized protein n=1 Tax=Bombilactobacillus thymidiniphilus TaxID=2923363 RepID=A0ABY4PD73_9LACO|nr:hypothetical protein [Bombilactobacillus thymidiniphilus]UQS83657.1 hypothetical protein MOO47_00180 [Bombilactobacillus thymidiniphilus]
MLEFTLAKCPTTYLVFSINTPKYGKKANPSVWLFNYGKKDANENGLYKDLITDHGTYNSIDLRGKLILLTMLKQKAGDDSFTKM